MTARLNSKAVARIREAAECEAAFGSRDVARDILILLDWHDRAREEPPIDLAFTTLRHANEARDEEWNTGAEKISLAFRGVELAGEAGEACNVIKKLERATLGIAGSRASLADLAAELADVVICADLIAMHAGIDLEAAIVGKFNATSEKYRLKTRIALAEEV